MGKIDIVLQKTLTDYNSRIAERFKSLKKLIPGKIGDLSNIVLDNPTEGQVLTYSGGRWVNADAKGGGGVSGDYLPLTGGTIFGSVEVHGKDSQYGKVVVGDSSSTCAIIHNGQYANHPIKSRSAILTLFKNGIGEYRALMVHDDGVYYYKNDTLDLYTVLHTGNTAYYTKEYRDAEGTNIDTLATQGSYIAEINKPTGTLPSSAMSTSWIQLFNWGNQDTSTSHNGYGVQMAGHYTSNGSLYFRCRNNQQIYPWRTLLDSENFGSWAVKKSGDTMTGSLTLTNATLTGYLVAGSNTYRLYAGGGAEYVWFDCRNSSGTMVSAFQLYPSRLNISVPITFNGMGGGFYMNDTTWIRTYGGKSFYHDTGTMRTDGVFQVGSNGSRFVVTADGNVGVGVTNPASLLHVNGAITSTSIAIKGTANSDAVITSDASTNIYIRSNGIIPFVVNGKDKVVRASLSYPRQISLGTVETPWLDVYADALLMSEHNSAATPKNNFGIYIWSNIVQFSKRKTTGEYIGDIFRFSLDDLRGTFYGYCDFTAGAGNSGSDMRFKTRIMPVPPVLDDIKDLEIFSYLWQKEGETAKDTFGLNANQLLSKGGIYAKMVHVRPDAEKTQWVEYERAGLLALKGVQELYGKLLEKGVIEA